ncbi:MAG: DUF3108 domain-containing protein [Deltaproteobacteria bacterium]|nr:DUF3108 domain-containing protein [Deltaproteobacteria bacterium]
MSILRKSESCRHPGKCLARAFIPILLLCLVSGGAEAADRKIPFHPGERLTYRATWGVLPAGDLTLEVLPMESMRGVAAYHFAMTTKTNTVIDLVYKVRERQDSYVDEGMTHSILYKKWSEGEHPRDVVVDFNWEKREATRSNFGEKMTPVPLAPGSFDSLALFFVIRLYDLKENRTLEIPITRGDNSITVRATVVKREKIEIAGKPYDAFEVVPDMERLERDKVIKKSDTPELRIWFTTDARKIPVKIRSKVKVGHFVFELVGANLGE